LKQVSEEALLGSSGSSEPGLYSWQWEPIENHETAAHLLSTADLETQLRPAVAKVAANPEIQELTRAYSALHRAAVDYILEAFLDSFGAIEPGQPVSTDDLAAKIGLVPLRRQLWNRLCQILRDAGVLEAEGESSRLVRVRPHQNRRDRLDAFLSRFPAARAEAMLLDRCGSHLAEVLAGRQEPLELIFPAGDLSLASRFYETSPGSRAMNALVRDSILQAIPHVPERGHLRILEAGAGTGGTTAVILPHLPDTAQYVFTDISPFFLAKAEQKFQNYASVRYQLFDLERRPETQGFELHSFDIVLAAQAVHATADLRRTLGGLRDLLAPGGLLVLLEETVPIPWVDLVFGLTEGWWKFTDRDLRPSYPLLSLSGWNRALVESGFDGIAALNPAADSPELSSAPCVIIARNPSIASGRRESASAHWLILPGRTGFAQILAERLRARGDLCTCSWLTPEGPPDFRQILQDAGLVSPLTGVIVLSNLDAPDSSSLTPDALEASVGVALGSSLALVQAIRQFYPSAPPKIWFFTRGAVAAGDGSIPGLAQSPLWGFGKVLALEFPEMWGGLVDLCAEEDDRTLEAVIRTLSQPGEDFLAIRDRKPYRARIVPEPLPASVPCSFEPHAAYLITGGLGTLGLKLAAWMAEQGAKHLVLLGRSSPSLHARALIGRLRSAGCVVRPIQADVCDRKGLEDVFQQIDQSGLPLRGVIHAAGFGRYRTIDSLDSNSMALELRPKVIGAWLLHELTRDRPLDFFIAYSSMVSLWGAKGQAAYAAANQFLDILAHFRRSCGLPGLTVNWGLWASEDRAGLIRQLEPMGVRMLRPRTALEMLGRLLPTGITQVGIADIDWSVMKRLYETRRRRPLFEKIAVETAASPAPATSSFCDLLEHAPSQERFSLLQAGIASELASAIGLDPSQTPEAHQGFFDLGMDSLMAVEFKNRLEARLACTLPSTVAFDYPTLDTLTRYLFTEVFHWTLEKIPEPARREAQQQPTSAGDELTSEQLEDSIARELTELEAMLSTARSAHHG
jgi:SAM-dependent methyltransferase/acyl carrier protein